MTPAPSNAELADWCDTRADEHEQIARNYGMSAEDGPEWVRISMREWEEHETSESRKFRLAASRLREAEGADKTLRARVEDLDDALRLCVTMLETVNDNLATVMERNFNARSKALAHARAALARLPVKATALENDNGS